jgi:hypothetical protein
MGENVVRGSFHFHYHLIAFKLKPNQTKALPEQKKLPLELKQFRNLRMAQFKVSLSIILSGLKLERMISHFLWLKYQTSFMFQIQC